MAVAALLAFLSPSYWLYYAAIVGSVVAVSKARITRICVKITIVYHTLRSSFRGIANETNVVTVF